MHVSAAATSEGSVRWAPNLQARFARGIPGPIHRRFSLPRAGKSRLGPVRLRRLAVLLCQFFAFFIVLDALRARWLTSSDGIGTTARTTMRGKVPGTPQEKITLSHSRSEEREESDPQARTSDKTISADSANTADEEVAEPRQDSQESGTDGAANSDTGEEVVTENNSETKPWEVLPRRSDWEEEAPPAWCAKLTKEPRPWAATPGTPVEKKRCARRTDQGECYDGSPITFFSQHHQDVYIYLKHFKNLRRRGSYLDIGANEPIDISNTFFMDRCLGWKGVCVEANPRYFDGLTNLRSCNLVRTCISDNNNEATFRLSDAVGGLEETVETARKPTDKTVKLRCKTLKKVAAEYKLTMVDYLSLDVEGNEFKVLKGWDPKKLVVKVINVKSNKTSVDKILVNAGYRRHFTELVEPGAKPGPEFDLRFHMDWIYLHESVTWGKPE